MIRIPIEVYLRSKYALQNYKTILYVGRLTPKKAPI